MNLLLVVGDKVYEQDHIDSILDGLPEEYNSFVMQMYSSPDPQYLYDVESFPYVQEAQLDQFYQVLQCMQFIEPLVCVIIYLIVEVVHIQSMV